MRSAALSLDLGLEIVALATGVVMKRFDRLHDADISTSPDGRNLAIASEDGLTVLDASMTEVLTLKAAEGCRYPSWSRDGRRLATFRALEDDRAEVLVWDIEERRPVLARPTNGGVRTMVLSADGTQVAMMVEPTTERPLPDRITVLNVEDGTERQVASAVREGGRVRLTFVPDGSRVLAIDGKGNLEVIESRTARVLLRLPAMDERIRSVVFDRDRLITLSENGVLRSFESDVARALTVWR